MTDELVKRLRVPDPVCQEQIIANLAADRIEQLAVTIEALTAKVEQLGCELNVARYGQPDFAWSVHLAAMAELTARAEKAEAERDRLIRAGDLLSVCAQTTGGTAGRDNGLVDAIQGWGDARAALKGESNE